VVRACQTFYCHYCLSVLTVLHLSVLPQTLSMESASNDHNTQQHQRKNLVTQKQ
jgi:hypothetical protein